MTSRTLARPAAEILEGRRMLSATSITEAEPNNTTVAANAVDQAPDQDVAISGRVDRLGDRDWFKLQLQAGDVLGAAVKDQSKLNSTLQLIDAGGNLVIANDDSSIGRNVLPAGSPLPHNQSGISGAEIYYVISAAGTYYLEVGASGDATVGRYELTMRVTRPTMERQAAGARQVLFLDFDGAKVDLSRYTHDVSGVRRFAPLVDSLPGWGISAAQIDLVIDDLVAEVTAKLGTYVQANGLNPTAGIEVRNSRDDADTYGADPLVARIVVGAVDPRDHAAFGFDGLAQHIDVGNLVTSDEAIVAVNFVAFAMANTPTAPPLTARDVVRRAVSDVAVHEAGHLLGCFHSDQPSLFGGTPNIMDPNVSSTIGPDQIFGTADDIPLNFGLDTYYAGDPFRGRNDTLNTVAFGMSTGQVAEPTPARLVATPARSLVGRGAYAAHALLAKCQ